EEETVDRLSGPVAVPHHRQRMVPGWLERPEVLARLRIEGPRRLRRRYPPARVNRPLSDPRLEVGDDPVGELAIGRHLHILVAQGLHEEALGRVAGDDRRPAVAALLEALGAVEEQSALDPLRLPGVALVAVLHEDRPDALLEEIHLA